MNEQELKGMEMHMFYDGLVIYTIHRVHNGWNYIYFNDSGSCMSTVFVPEISIIQEHNVPRLRSF